MLTDWAGSIQEETLRLAAGPVPLQWEMDSARCMHGFGMSAAAVFAADVAFSGGNRQHAFRSLWTVPQWRQSLRGFVTNTSC